MSDYAKSRVIELFAGGNLYCAETVLAILAEAGGRNPADVIPLATGFCSGASRTSGQCGAFSGAIMGLGLYAGRTEPGGDYESVYAMVQELQDRFLEKCGSINCYELVECDLYTPEGREKFKEKRLLRKCVQIAAFATETALELLRENGFLPDYDELVQSRLAPCGLSCGQCLAFSGGPIQESSARLKQALGENFSQYAKRFEGMNPVFEKYPQFAELLEFLASGSCGGCRESGCLFKDCQVPSCAKENGVAYCFECEDFPCDRHGMPAALAERWKANNEKMREMGVDAWFSGCALRPRYP